MPKSAETAIDIGAFEKKIEEVSSKMTASEARRASKIVGDLKNGANSYQKGPLPPIKTATANCTYEHENFSQIQLPPGSERGLLLDLSGFPLHPAFAPIH